jgi:RNA polymerase sigma-70 factor, ECF subfamily
VECKCDPGVQAPDLRGVSVGRAGTTLAKSISVKDAKRRLRGCAAGPNLNAETPVSPRGTPSSYLTCRECICLLSNHGRALARVSSLGISRQPVNHPDRRGVLQLYGEQLRMQELVLAHPGGTSLGESGDNPRDVPGDPFRIAHGAPEPQAEAATRELFEQHLAECGPLAFRVARGVLRNTADAEDVAQEALLRAYRRFRHLRERDRFRAWLVRIAFRLALDRVRSAKRREMREAMWARPERKAPVASAEDLAVRSQFEEQLERALDELPERLRLVLLLSAMQEHTLEEVASMLGVPSGTVKSRLFVARKKLAEKLRCRVNTTKR